MAGLSADPVNTCSIAFDDPAFNEAAFALMEGVANAADIDAGQMVPVATVEPLDAGPGLGPYRTPAAVVDRVVAADHASPEGVRF